MRSLTLTFDNGPDPDVTPQVLDVLAGHGILATFFVVGEKLAAAGGRRLAERAHAAGHWLGNHTYSHSVPLGLQPDEDVARDEISRTQDLIADLAHPSRLFRPFGGGGNLDRRLLSTPVVDYLTTNAFTCVLWNAIPRDWEDPTGWVDRAIDQCHGQDWTLMVIHDIATGAMDHLDAFLRRAAAEGIAIRQDFPAACVPIRDGTISMDLAPYVSRDRP